MVDGATFNSQSVMTVAAIFMMWNWNNWIFLEQEHDKTLYAKAFQFAIVGIV